jgi:hypothetical protein
MDADTSEGVAATAGHHPTFGGTPTNQKPGAAQGISSIGGGEIPTNTC